MAQILPSNLYDPVMALDYVLYKWYENTTVISKLARTGDPTAPIQLNLRNAILSSGGQYIHAPTWNPVPGLVSRRDMTITTDATPLNASTRDDIGVRVNRKIGPFSYTRSAAWMSGQTPAQFSQYFAQEALNRMALDMRQFVLGIAKAQITNMGVSNTKNVYLPNSRTNVTTTFLSQVRSLLGDKVDEAFAPGGGAAFVFRSEAWTDLILNQENAGVQGIADRAQAGASPLTLALDYCLANDSSLIVPGSPYNEYDTLLLGPGFMEMDIVNMSFTPEWMNPKSENVEFVLRGDYDLEFRSKGFKWDTVGGGANPTLATASTPANWINVWTDPREIWGCLGRSNASAS